MLTGFFQIKLMSFHFPCQNESQKPGHDAPSRARGGPIPWAPHSQVVQGSKGRFFYGSYFSWLFWRGLPGWHTGNAWLASIGSQFCSHVAGHGAGIGEAGPIPGTRAEHSSAGVMITRCSASEGHLPPCGEWKLHKVPSKKFNCGSPPFHRTLALCYFFFNLWFLFLRQGFPL